MVMQRSVPTPPSFRTPVDVHRRKPRKLLSSIVRMLVCSTSNKHHDRDGASAAGTSQGLEERGFSPVATSQFLYHLPLVVAKRADPPTLQALALAHRLDLACQVQHSMQSWMSVEKLIGLEQALDTPDRARVKCLKTRKRNGHAVSTECNETPGTLMSRGLPTVNSSKSIRLPLFYHCFKPRRPRLWQQSQRIITHGCI